MKRISICVSPNRGRIRNFCAQKKSLLLVFALTCTVFGAVAQQKVKDGSISTTNLPNKDAIVELESANKGMLFSRIALEGTMVSAPLSAHVAGMMVYNTAKTSDVVPGIYYNTGSRWILAGAGKASNISYNPTTFEISFLNADNKPVVINLGDVVRQNQTITTLIDNKNGTYTYTAEDGKITTINVPADVINQFEQIANNTTVRQIIQSIVTKTGGNVYYDGKTFTYIDKNGVTQTINIAQIVKDNETITTLVNNNNGTYTYTAENGKTTVINVPAEVINNFQSIANDNSVKQIIENIVKNTAGNVFYDGANFTYIDVNGVKQIINIAQLVQANETVTTLVKNTDGTYTYTNEKNEKVNIDVIGDAVNNIVNLGNLYTTIKNLFNKSETVTSLVYNATDNTLTYTDEAHVANVIDIVTLVRKNQLTTSLTNGITTEVSSTSSASNASNTEYKVEVKNGAITTEKLADASVTNGKIGADAITTDKIKDGEVKTADIADAAISTEKINNKAVTAAKLDAGTGTNGRIAVADAAGNVSYSNTMPGTSIAGEDVTAASNKIILGGTPAGAALKRFSVDVDETKLNLNANQIKGGTAGQVMVVGADLKGAWVDQSAVTSVSNNSSANALNTTVNGKTGQDVKIINSNVLTMDAATKSLTSTVNGVASNALDLSAAIAASQKTTTVSNGTNTTATGTTTGNVTDYKVNVNNASATTTGAVKPGSGLAIDNDGTLSVEVSTITSGKALNSTDLSISAGGATSLLKDVTVDIKSGAVNSDKIADGSVTGTDIALKTVAATNLTAAGAATGDVATANADGTVTYQAVNAANVINGKNLTAGDASIVIGTGTGATLVDANVKVAVGGICTDKIANGAVTINKIANAAPYNVMTTDDAGTPAWVPQSSLIPATTVSNLSAVNTLTTTVNGVTGNGVEIINSNALCLDSTRRFLTSIVNGYISGAIDISPVVTATQKTTTLSNGTNTSVASTTTGNVTDYKVNVPTACIETLGVVKQAPTNAAVTINAAGELVANANNGLTVANANVQLGGQLNQATTITTTANNTLAVAGLQPGTMTDKIVAADDNGILRVVKAAMPRFFYMPSMLLNTETVGATYTVNLYNEYKSQFTNIPASQRSSATSNIPFIPTAAELDYYVTYFDNTVIQIVSVQADGTLTYKVTANAKMSSFVNIVFVVK
ncbi:beta strand repeat-containing protein [Pedobacter endophyticus]|uniref:Collagen triple helix repeat-containing protein n=1 Tax=Pedobacter endophyticus TaxID=2789740 RepID=A0A7S9PZP3_9SPHI|nr:hypothetical protein [Pedobacter endophyticus]QPH40145.1 hypothetical protein IZT61_02370 [Pedobacter endophyticus]